MPYTLSDVKGHISAGPTVHGLRQMKKVHKKQKDKDKKYPATSHLFEYGWTSKTVALNSETQALAKEAPDKDTKDAFSQLGKAASRASELIALEH